MENNFYRDHFEQLLKDSADNFRLYPSRRVWHGIYNNIHPGKKWPSFAVLILLIFTISYLGITNPTISTPQLVDNSISRHETALDQNSGFIPAILRSYATNQTISNSGIKTLHNIKLPPTQISASGHNVILADNDITKSILPTTISEIVTASNTENVMIGEETSQIAKSEIVTDSGNEALAGSPSNDLAKTEKGWVEDYALHNINPKSKERQKWSFQIYATPSVGYRILQKSDDLPESNSRSMIASATEDDYYINHSNALNLEAGGNLLYSISDRFRVKAGIQFNYTNFYVSALDLNHPSRASVPASSRSISPLYPTTSAEKMTVNFRCIRQSQPIGIPRRRSWT